MQFIHLKCNLSVQRWNKKNKIYRNKCTIKCIITSTVCVAHTRTTYGILPLYSFPRRIFLILL